LGGAVSRSKDHQQTKKEKHHQGGDCHALPAQFGRAGFGNVFLSVRLQIQLRLAQRKRAACR